MIDTFGKLINTRFFHRPIFVMGLGRSGTTPLFGGIAKHPHIIGISSEFPFLGHISRLPYLYEFAEEKSYYLDALQVSKRYLYQQLRRTIFEAAFGRYCGLKAPLMTLYRRDRHFFSKRFWCAKAFLTYDGYQGIQRLYPEAKFLYIVRNGYDVVESRTRFRPFAQISFPEHCRTWTESVEKYRYVSEIESGLQICQEDLLARPEDVFKKVFDFIGLVYHPASQEFLQNTLMHPRDSPSHGDVVGDVRRILAARAPAYANWTQEQKNIFKDTCGTAMHETGYELPF